MGSTGPTSEKLETEKPWAAEFPIVTISDMVAAQERLISWLGIEQLFAIVGGSMGGMQALEWMRRYPERMRGIVALATSFRQNVQGIAFHEVGRQAIMKDPDWKEGDYSDFEIAPNSGLAVARMIAHITYLSEEKLAKRFNRQLQSINFKSYSFDPDFQVASYLNHQGFAFAHRFDPNSYLYITRAIDYFDQSEPYGGCLEDAYINAVGNNKPVVLLVSVTSDWTYPPSESSMIEVALKKSGINVRHITVESDEGHDAFLLPNSKIEGEILFFLSQTLRVK